ncbi:MAG: hypothetical protein ACOZQL_11690 [Myxococcota bacterium]
MRWLFVLSLLWFACDPGRPVVDSGDDVDASVSMPGDAGAEDAGAEDAGTDDAGVTDAGTVDAGQVDAGPADGGTGSSHGSGKLACSRTGTVSTSAGVKTYCVATVGGVELKIIEPDDVATNAAPLQLALYVHGDGARAYFNDTAPRLHAPWTTRRHVLYVAALAPNTCAWWTKPSVNPCDAGVTTADRDQDGLNADALEAVVTALRAHWDLADAPVLFGGASGGSIFLSADYLPRYGAAHPGVWALSCGGEIPWTPITGDVRSSFLSFTWGDQDFLLPDITAAVAWFGDAGVPLATRVIAGAQHCAFDHLGRTVEIWDAGR